MSPIIITSCSLAVTGMFFYIVAILMGKTVPHRTTRFVQFVVLLLGTIGLYTAHDHSTFIVNCIYTLSTFTVFLLSLKWGVGGWNKIDIICLSTALLGIIVWQISKDPIVAIVASMLASFFGTIPAFIKTYRIPTSESWPYYFCSFFANGIIIFAHDVHTVSNTMFPLYYVLWNATFLVLILRRYKKARH